MYVLNKSFKPSLYIYILNLDKYLMFV
jgi:hypothetical protein